MSILQTKKLRIMIWLSCCRLQNCLTAKLFLAAAALAAALRKRGMWRTVREVSKLPRCTDLEEVCISRHSAAGVAIAWASPHGTEHTAIPHASLGNETHCPYDSWKASVAQRVKTHSKHQAHSTAAGLTLRAHCFPSHHTAFQKTLQRAAFISLWETTQ
jgi:hypothetical protein